MKTSEYNPVIAPINLVLTANKDVIPGAKALLAKLIANEKTTDEDIKGLWGYTVPTNTSLDDRRQAISVLIAILDHPNKNHYIDRCVLNILSSSEGLFNELGLNESAINTIISKLSLDIKAGKILKELSKSQPLPRSVHIELSKTLQLHPSKNKTYIIEAIDNSLSICNEIIDNETIANIVKSLPFEIDKNEEAARNRAAKLLINYSKVNLQYTDTLDFLSNEGIVSDLSIKEEAAKVHKYNAEVRALVKHAENLDKNADKFVVNFTLKKFHSAVDNKTINVTQLGLDKYIESALSKTTNPSILLPEFSLLAKVTDCIRPESLQLLCNKLPFGEEKQDWSILRSISLRFTEGKIKEFPESVIIKIQELSNDNKNAQNVRQEALSLLDKLGVSLPKISSSANDNIKILVEASDCRTVTELKQELLTLNDNNVEVKSFVSKIDSRLNAIAMARESDSLLASQGVKISTYNRDQLLSWSTSVRNQKLSLDNNENVAEVMAIISRAVEIDSKYLPRAGQLMAVLHLLDSGLTNNGRLLQVKTGEGKSLITAMLAAGKVLLTQKPVDIITSSSILAKRDASSADGQKKFFELLSISCADNCFRQSTGTKECYKSDVVYGDTLNFQADYLRTVFKGENIRGERPFASVIVDEVDSMLIDESSKIVKLAMPICGMEHLETMFIFISGQIENMDLSRERLEDQELITRLKQDLTELISSLILPSHKYNQEQFKIIVPIFLHDFVTQQSTKWAESALRALSMQENIDYVIARNEDNQQIIAPVDYDSTGVVQKNTSWSNGLHQFLQVKHRLRITPESLTTSFISNMSYFKLYGSDLSGMSGTLGSVKEKELLQEVYKLDTAIIPTFKEKIFARYKDHLTTGTEEHIEKIATNAILQAKEGRAVLIICTTIAEGLDMGKAIKELNHQGRLQQYLGIDEGNNASELEAESGDIIVATNLAGRGTDIKTSSNIEKNGGLHVIIGFLPNNLRTEEQAFGRTSRQGNKGSGEIIINATKLIKKYQQYDVDFQKDFLNTSNESEIIAYYRVCRDKIEELKLDQAKDTKVKSLEFEDQLFQRFNQEIYQQLKNQDDNKQKLMQLEDLWGFWLIRQQLTSKKISNSEERLAIETNFLAFKKDVLSRYGGSKILENPAYMGNYVLNKLGDDPKYNEPCDLLSDPDSFDPIYSYQLHYLKAYSSLRHNDTIDKQSKASTEWRQKHTAIALTSTEKAKMQIDNVIIPQLQSAVLLLGPDSNNTPLHKQLDNKIRLLETASKNLKENIDFITNNNKPGKNTIKISEGPLQSYMSLFSNEIDPKDIAEFGNFGMSFLYDAGAKAYSKDYITGTIVALAGIAQVIVGAVIAIGSLGLASELGVSLAAAGVSDLISGIKAASKGQEIPLGDWLKQKGIELAVTMAMHGISKGIGKLPGTAVTTTKMTAYTFGRELVLRVAQMEITKIGCEFVAGKVSKIAARPIKAEIKHMRQAIKESFHREPVYSRVTQICFVDAVQTSYGQGAIYQNELRSKILSVLDRKSSQFTAIAQQLLTHTISSSVSASGGGAIASMAVMAASTGVSVVQGIGEINDLKSYIISDINHFSAEVASSLPGFTGMLQSRNHSLSEEAANQIFAKLQSGEVIDSGLKVDVSKIDQIEFYDTNSKFEFGIDRLVVSNKEQEEDTKLIDNSDLTKVSNIELVDLSREQAQWLITNSHTNTGAISSEFSQSKIDLGEQSMHASEARQLLIDIDVAGTKSHDAEINKLSEDIAETVGQRMRGLITAKVISPITGELVKAATHTLITWVKTQPILQSEEELLQTKKNAIITSSELEQKFLLENYLNAKEKITGVSGGDEYTERKMKIYEDKNAILVDDRDDEDIPKLEEVVKLEENREFNTMLRAIRDYQHEDKQVPIFDISQNETTQDYLKPVKIFDVRSGITIAGNDHGVKKDSFVRNEKEVTSYRNSLGQFTKKPSLYNYSINAHVPLVSFGGQEYAYDLVNSREGYLGDVKVQGRFTPYVMSYLNANLGSSLNSNIGWQAGVLVGRAEFADGSQLTTNILETSGVAGFNIGKSGFNAAAGLKASIANIKYNTEISEKCFRDLCFEGDVALEVGCGIGAKANIGVSDKKLKMVIGGGAVGYVEGSIQVSFSKNKEYFAAQQKHTEQIQAKYNHFSTEIKKYSTDVISKISMMDMFDFGNHEDFDSILMLAKTYSKK